MKKQNLGRRLFLNAIKNPKLIYKAIQLFLSSGFQAVVNKVRSKFLFENLNINDQYEFWVKENKWEWKDTRNQRNEIKKLNHKPLISIITPIYNTDEKFLKECIESVIKQSYENWELCLVDDCSDKPEIRKIIEDYSKKDKRIRYLFREKRGHISEASNSALKIASGEFISFLDHDDVLTGNALFEVIKALNVNKKLDIIYSDEDKLEVTGKLVDPFFKPDWSPHLLLAINYIAHFTTIKKSIIDSIGGFRKGYEGSQDFDLFLRVSEKSKYIFHIPKILYHWRKIEGSTASDYLNKNYAYETSKKALKDAMTRRNIKASILPGVLKGSFRVRREIINNPKISIIIPTKDKVDYLQKCINSVLKKTTYKNYEIILISNNSEEKSSFEYFEDIKKNNTVIKFYEFNKPYNYSEINNFAVSKAEGKYLCLLNNDTEIITESWLEDMLEMAQREEVGAVGVKLLYKSGLIQHAGVTLGIMGGITNKGVAGHLQKMSEDKPTGFVVLNTKDLTRDFSAVTAACLMVRKSKYEEVGGLEESLAIAFNDVDLCLKLRKNGYFNVYIPYVKVNHYESISVGSPSMGTRDISKFKKEISYMYKKWGSSLLRNDPFFNPNFSLNYEEIALKTGEKSFNK